MSLLSECYRRLSNSSTSNQQPLKGYKVTDVNRTRKIGVACRSLYELKQKACAKFNVTNDLSEIEIYLLDGSEIDEDYFTTLEPQTTLIFRRPGEKLLTEADVLYQMLRRVNESFFQKGQRAEELLTVKFKDKISLLNEMLNSDDSKTMLTSPEEHPEWFDGLETRARTKEAYLHRRCQDRIRGYLYKMIEQVRLSDEYNRNSVARKQLQSAIAFFKLQLKKDHYFGFYFDRSYAITAGDDEIDSSEKTIDCTYEHCPCKMSISSYERYILGLTDDDIEKSDDKVDDAEDTDSDEVDAKKLKMSPQKEACGGFLTTSDREELQKAEAQCKYKIVMRHRKDMKALCDERGEFRCNGVWNRDVCLFTDKHRINPYRSKEELILFSTWNLDHKIERSRTIVPQLLEASRNDELFEDKVIEFYNNLFTVKNLKLVHIVCHDKGSHK
ncbi:DNA fragmentation factor subunit beta [Copidosoma floridanum]|uniref:DNA fragmentation factor subunit beta n=1 Tax=Copidosoma floridanum TaxID=29053 RepID=UPI0006C9840B|nr:DNA fragmentation factor subunit beta [Copidosoma floridanum]